MQTDDKTNHPRVRIHERALRKLWAYIDACEQEVGGLGLVERGDAALLVTDVFLIHQEVTPSTTDLDPVGIAKLAEDLLSRGIDLGQLRFWWHSHAESPAYWSPVDRETSRKLSGADFCLSFVGNRRREHRLMLDIGVPFRMGFDHVPFETVLEIDSALADAVRKEVADKVRHKKPSFFGSLLGLGQKPAYEDECPVEDRFPLYDRNDRKRHP